jgi:hypothetical protein
MVRSTQTVDLSCTKISCISKQTKTSIHLSLVTLEYHRVRPKWFLSLWYVCRKPCTYLAPMLKLSQKGLKWDSTWPTSPRCSSGVSKMILSSWYVRHKPCMNLAPILTLSPNAMKLDSTRPTSPRCSIRCVQNDLWAYGMFDANRTPILHQSQHYLQKDRNDHPLEPCHLGVPSGASKIISEPMVHYANPCSYLASRLAPSSNRPNWASTWASSPRRTIRSVQNDFWVYGTFSANRAPILHWD